MATEIITGITVWIDRTDDPADNWADQATEKFMSALADTPAGDIEDYTYEDLDEYTAARIKVAGAWYDIEVGHWGDRNEVRAVEVEVDL